MPMSDEELRALRELERELAEQRRMVSLSQRLSSANVDTGLSRIVALWIAGGSTGFLLVIVGAVARSAAVLGAAVIVLAATLILAGLASVAVEANGCRHDNRPGGGQPRSTDDTDEGRALLTCE